ncbi:MAG: calcium-binding protein [Actinomycetota bacterium]
MSRSIVTIMKDPGRIAAKAILAATIGLLAVLLATTSFGDAMAAHQPGPAKIHLVNPEVLTSNILSDKNDGSNETYHLVAWTAAAPAAAVVEFEITRTSGSPTVTLNANRLGNDTWEHFWAIPSNFPDGTYTVTASLFTATGGTQLAQDTEPVTINQSSSFTDPNPAAETVEITYPINAGPLGVKRVRDSLGTVRGANFVMQGTASSGTTYVVGYYSTAPAGEEPAFKECLTRGGASPRYQPVGTTSSSDTTRSFTYRCLVAEGDATSPINAVALVANDTPRIGIADPIAADPADDDSGDGHRTFSYDQIPTTLQLEPSQTHNANVDNCVMLTARVLDQNGRPIAGQNVDVHATGPSDQLRFNAITSDPNQPPNNGPHTLDTAHNCSSGAAIVGGQGEHNVAGGIDVKHIESAVSGTEVNQAGGGTSDDGVFRFQLKTDAPGGTWVSAWADTLDNDEWAGPGTNEPCGNASIGWGTTAPAPTGASPEFANCLVMPAGTQSPTPTPTPTATTTATPTPTATTTATPTPTATTTGTPTPTATATGTATPTPTATSTTTPPPGARCPGYTSDPRNHVVGTPGDDQLNGTSGNDIICGLGGDDMINGLGGHDLLLGGDGNDTINGDAGNDEIDGGNGDDTIDGGEGHDDIDGGDGKDSIVGGDGDDEIHGGLQNDVILGNAGNDTLVGASGFDVIRGGRDHDTIKGGGGRDSLRGFTGNDIIRGGSGEDTLSGGRGADFLKGGKGNDLLKGGRGHDDLLGGGGTDTCDGGPGKNYFVSCERRAN